MAASRKKSLENSWLVSIKNNLTILRSLKMTILLEHKILHGSDPEKRELAKRLETIVQTSATLALELEIHLTNTQDLIPLWSNLVAALENLEEPL